MKRALAAVAFLTRVPIRGSFTAEDVGRGGVFFPLVGAGIGLVQLGLWKLASPRVSTLLVAVLIVSLGAWITRGLHLDGLADFADGLGGGGTNEEALGIMKDSRIGSFGAIALVLVLGAKVAAIDALAEPWMLVLAPALSRWTAVALGFAVPYARRDVPSPTRHGGRLELAGATLTAGAIAALLGGALAVGSVVVVSFVVAVIAKRRIGGVTGDVLGANVELAETAALVTAV